jgi:DNA-binding transcriptional LysR family regulator
VLRLGALESTTASRLPPVLAAYHEAYPRCGSSSHRHQRRAHRARSSTAASTPPSSPRRPRGEELAHLPLFSERLVLITERGHRPVRGPKDVTAVR